MYMLLLDFRIRPEVFSSNSCSWFAMIVLMDMSILRGLALNRATANNICNHLHRSAISIAQFAPYWKSIKIEISHVVILLCFFSDCVPLLNARDLFTSSTIAPVLCLDMSFASAGSPFWGFAGSLPPSFFWWSLPPDCSCLLTRDA